MGELLDVASDLKGKCGRRGLPPDIVNAIYTDYLRLKSCAKTAALWGRTRQSIWELIKLRKETLKRRFHDEPVIYRGKKFTPSKNGYLRITQRGGRKETQLNRIVWEDVYGPIPAGHQVMFKDGDMRNFSIDNLECLPIAEVSRRTATGENQHTGARIERLAASMRLFIIKESNKAALWFHADTMELQQIGTLAAMKSAKRWRSDRGASFYTYSHREIRQAIMRHASAGAMPVHIPDAKRRAGGFSAVSIDAPVGDDPDGATWGDLNLSTDETTTDEIDGETRAAALLKVIKRLPKREREILRARFFDNRTLDAIAIDMGVSRQRVNQMEAAILRKLRRSRNLKKVAA